MLSEGGNQPGPRMGNLSGRWVDVEWEGERFTVELGKIVHLLPPAHETESPSA